MILFIPEGICAMNVMCEQDETYLDPTENQTSIIYYNAINNRSAY